MYTSLF